MPPGRRLSVYFDPSVEVEVDSGTHVRVACTYPSYCVRVHSLCSSAALVCASDVLWTGLGRREGSRRHIESAAEEEGMRVAGWLEEEGVT